MNTKRNSFWYAVAMLVGSTVGVGIFGIPFVFSRAGVLPGILFLVALSGMVAIMNLAYGEVVLRTEAVHQMIGYVRKYLGKTPTRLIIFSFIFSIYGALLAYIILSGLFLFNLVNPFLDVSPVVLSSLFFVAGSAIIFAGLRVVSGFDLVMLLIFFVIVISIALVGGPSIDSSNYLLFDKQFWFLPFGVILFALTGASAIPLMRELVQGERGTVNFKKAILLGTLIPAFLYLVFALVVVGVSGSLTSPDAVSGLENFLGRKIVVLGSLFGLFAISTSFLGLGLALKESMELDFKLSRIWAWLVVVIPPFLLFIAGTRNFINVIDLVGGLSLSIEGILLFFLYVKARDHGDRIPEYSVGIPNWLIYCLMGIFASSAVYTLIK